MANGTPVNSVFHRGEQIFFLQTEKVDGVQSISVENNFGGSQSVSLTMGNRFHPLNYKGPQSTTISINNLLINKDFFYDHVVGNTLVNAWILKEQTNLTDNYCFISGYCSSYSCKYSVGELPQIAAQITFIDNAGKIATGNLKGPDISQLRVIQTGNFTGHLNPKVPFGGSISLSMGDFLNTNRIQSYEINISANKIPIYNIGSQFPKRIELIYPINVECSFSFELGQYDFTNLRDALETQAPKNLNITVRSFNTNDLIRIYSFTGLYRSTENYSTDTEGAVVANIKFVGQITR